MDYAESNGEDDVIGVEQEMDLHLDAAMNSTNKAADILCIGAAATAILQKNNMRHGKAEDAKAVEILAALTISDFLALANLDAKYTEKMKELEVSNLVDLYLKMDEWKEIVTQPDARILMDVVAQVCTDPNAYVDRVREMKLPVKK